MACDKPSCACKNKDATATHFQESTSVSPTPPIQSRFASAQDWSDNWNNINNAVPATVASTTVNYSYIPADVVTLLVKKLPNFVQLPEYKTEGAAAMDLYAAEGVAIFKGQTAIVPTGIAIAVPPGYEAQIRARSSLAAKGIIVTNSPGTIDSDYRGEIKIILTNVTNGSSSISPEKIKLGDRIAQLVIAPVSRATLRVVDDLDETIRGSGGFGSTGV